MSKMADFCNFFLLTGGQAGEESPMGGGTNAPSCPLVPPLRQARGQNHIQLHSWLHCTDSKSHVPF